MAHGRKHGSGGFVGSESGVRSKNQDYAVTAGVEEQWLFSNRLYMRVQRFQLQLLTDYSHKKAVRYGG